MQVPLLVKSRSRHFRLQLSESKPSKIFAKFADHLPHLAHTRSMSVEQVQAAGLNARGTPGGVSLSTPSLHEFRGGRLGKHIRKSDFAAPKRKNRR
jgi:hypothetical protein